MQPPLFTAPDGSPNPSALHDLPLWRADSAVLVGQQALLHVHTPHYVHMFDRLFASRRRPWLFGQVRLPEGSRNLGAPGWALCAPDSRAPTIGVLMEVNRAVRLEDGKLMVLATALCRIKVRQCLSETPYSRACVEVLHDDELLESLHAVGLRAALHAADFDSVAAAAAATACVGQPPVLEEQHRQRQQLQQPRAEAEASWDVETGLARDGGSAAAANLSPMLRAAAAAARAAATAATWCWLGYEASAARAAAWPGICPAEGSDPADTRRLVSELVDHGVLNVVPFADGPVAGRWDLATLRAAAAEDAAAAAAAAATQVWAGVGEDYESCCAGAAAPSSASEDVRTGVENASAGEGEAEIRVGAGPGTDSQGAATTPSRPQATGAEGGAGSGAGESSPVFSGGGGAGNCADTAAAASGGELDEDELGLTGHTTYDLLLLEARLWAELDALAVLQARAHSTRLGLPLGLLQLRPSDELAAHQLAAAAPPSVICRQQAGVHPAAASAASWPRSGSGDAMQSTTTGPARGGLAGHSGDDGAGGGVASSGGTAQALQHGSAQPRLHPASEGLDVYCHLDYPLERRIARMSYAAAGIFIEAQDSTSRQQLLEMSSIRLRLLEVLRRARAVRSVLAARAAVKSLRP